MYILGYVYRFSSFLFVVSKIARVFTENIIVGFISEVVYRED